MTPCKALPLAQQSYLCQEIHEDSTYILFISGHIISEIIAVRGTNQFVLPLNKENNLLLYYND